MWCFCKNVQLVVLAYGMYEPISPRTENNKETRCEAELCCADGWMAINQSTDDGLLSNKSGWAKKLRVFFAVVPESSHLLPAIVASHDDAPQELCQSSHGLLQAVFTDRISIFRPFLPPPAARNESITMALIFRRLLVFAFFLLSTKSGLHCST